MADPDSSTLTPTIPQMIESLSNLHKELSSAISKPSTYPQAAESVADASESAAAESFADTSVTDAETSGSSNAAELQKLLVSIEHLKGALEKTRQLEEKLTQPIQSIEANLKELIKRTLINDLKVEFLDAISKDVKTLKFQIPSYKKLSLAKTTADSVDSGTGLKADEFKLPNLYGHKVFDESTAFLEIKAIYDGFDPKFLNLKDVCKKCFLYFAVFPENVVFKKRFLTYWWIGERLFDPLVNKTPEVYTGEILKKFVEKGLIVPLKEDHKMVKKKFRMPPIVRSAAIKLAKDNNFLDYDEGNNPIAKSSGCDRIFLVKGGGSTRLKAPTASKNPNVPMTDKEEQELVDGIKSIFNVSQPFPDSALEWLAKKGVVDTRTTKAVEWLLRLINLEVLYLGRWQSEVDEQQIEVESYEFLKGLKKMKKLRLLSLQGISWINKLPNSLRTLSELRVLDLKSCFNLEKLPQGIGSLKNLTHLDVSGCYMLNEMPKSISNLTELTVLKGFISGSSNLIDLEGLKKLRKLSIIVSRQSSPNDTDLNFPNDTDLNFPNDTDLNFPNDTDLNFPNDTDLNFPNDTDLNFPNDTDLNFPNDTDLNFPNDTDLRVLQNLGEHGKLRNLTIMWGAEGVKKQTSPGEGVKKQTSPGKGGKKPSCVRNMIQQITKKLHPKEPKKRVVQCLPKELEKLEVQCLPEEKLPQWLNPLELGNLKRLYIRGGELKELGNGPWNAEVVRLKYISKLEIEWRKLLKSFPNLSYLQKVQCPNVTYCPCDANGVWTKP